MIKRTLKRSRSLTAFVRRLKIALLKRSRSTPIKEYLGTHRTAKLQLGCGTNFLPGWLNTDGALIKSGHVYIELTEKLPFADETFDYVFAEHTIEHIQYKDALVLLREVHRVLKPGAVLRLTTPDLQVYLQLFSVPRSEADEHAIAAIYRDWILPGFYAAKNYIPISDKPDPAFVLNDIFFNYEHRFIYTFDLLRGLLLAAGFGKIIQSSPSSSAHESLAGIETHRDDSSRYLTMALEASK